MVCSIPGALQVLQVLRLRSAEICDNAYSDMLTQRIVRCTVDAQSGGIQAKTTALGPH